MGLNETSVDKSGLEEFLAGLVRTPSVNPPGNEGPVSRLMAAKLSSLEFDVSTVEDDLLGESR
jgi:acetylornithine deacetylase/succinyl-diaminopimelate desuccinylase-like protein